MAVSFVVDLSLLDITLTKRQLQGSANNDSEVSEKNVKEDKIKTA